MKKLLFVCLALPLFISCKKNDDCETTVAKIAGTYRVSSLKYKQTPTSAEQDFFMLMDACERDDRQVLNENGTYSYQDAGMVCTPNGSFTGTWSLNGNTLIIDGETSTVVSFDCTTLVFTVTNYITPGDIATFTIVKV